MNLKIVYGFQHVPNMTAFDLWPFDLVKSNIPVLHSLSSEVWQNFNWNSIILFKFFFWNIKMPINIKSISGSEELSGLNNLIRHDNITGLNDLNSLFALKK